MFDIGFPELLLVAIVGLLVIGPERLPEALRTLGLWLGRMRRSFVTVKTEIEKEIGMDEVRRQLHNEQIMEEMKRIEAEVKGTVDDARQSIDEGANAIDPKKAIDPKNATDPKKAIDPKKADTATSPAVQKDAAASVDDATPDHDEAAGAHQDAAAHDDAAVPAGDQHAEKAQANNG